MGLLFTRSLQLGVRISNFVGFLFIFKCHLKSFPAAVDHFLPPAPSVLRGTGHKRQRQQCWKQPPESQRRARHTKQHSDSPCPVWFISSLETCVSQEVSRSHNRGKERGGGRGRGRGGGGAPPGWSESRCRPCGAGSLCAQLAAPLALPALRSRRAPR